MFNTTEWHTACGAVLEAEKARARIGHRRVCVYATRAHFAEVAEGLHKALHNSLSSDPESHAAQSDAKVSCKSSQPAGRCVA